MNHLNKVETTLFVSGNQIYFRYLKLHQALNAHHRFDIEVDFQELEPQWMNDPIQIVKLIGEQVNISMKHCQTKESNDFREIITHVE